MTDVDAPAGYQILRTLGEGGMGRVYEAVHVPSGTRVALKTLRPEHDTQATRRALLNEATTIAQLRDPNIVELLDVGRGADGSLFLVVEHIDGGDLERWGERWPGTQEVLRVFGEVLSALSAAHGQQIVHGDLKPANVLLTRDGHAKVVDFGIALVMDPLRDAQPDFGLAGTPMYMAPERFLGDAIGPWTDLYAIGVMLHELLSGDAPFGGRSLPALLEQKSADPPPLVPRPGVVVPEELRELVRALIAPNPRARPRFAAQVADALAELAPRVLDRALSGPTLAFDPTSTPEEIAALLSSVTLDSRTRESISSSAPTRSSSRSLRVETGSWADLPASALELGAALLRLRSIPLVGRARELRAVADLCEATIARGGARAALITGEAGVGKSRIARHFFAEVERTGTMEGVAAGYDATGSSMAGGLKHALRRLLGRPREDDPGAWAARVGLSGVEHVELLHEWLGGLQLASDRVATMAHAVLRRVSESRPVFVWLDDLGWSDDGAIALVDRLLDAQDARVVVVGTIRSGTVEHPTVRAKLERLLGRADVTRLEVTRMGAGDRRALLAAIAPLAPDVVADLADALDEPPLMLVELVRDWVASGQLAPSPAGLRPAVGSVAAALERRSVGAVIGERLDALLDGLTPEGRAAILRAALLGARFDEGSLRASCVDLPADAVDGALDHALLHGLLRVEPDRTYRFEHPLYQEALLQRLPSPGAHERAVAAGLRATYGDGRSDVLVRAAQLLRAVGEPASRELLREAIHACVREHMPDTASEHLAVLYGWLDDDRVPEGALERGLVHHMAAVVRYFELDYPAARERCERAIRIFREVGATDRVAESAVLIANTLFYEDRFVDAERACLALALEPDLSARARASINMRLADIYSLRGDDDASLRALEAITQARLDPFRHHVALCNLIEREIVRGNFSRTEELLEEMRRASKNGEGFALATEQMEARVQIVWGRYEEARASVMRQLHHAVEHQDPWNETSLRAHAALIAAAVDSAEEAEAEVRGLLAAWARVRHDEPFTYWAFDQIADRLTARGLDALAREVAQTIAARRAEIARAFAAG